MKPNQAVVIFMDKGEVRFQPGTPKKVVSTWKKLSKEPTLFRNGKYVELRVWETFKWVSQNTLRNLNLDHNYRENILVEVSLSAQFKNLKMLSLHRNSIRNLETLQFLDAPQLEHIYLSANQISSVRAVRKCRFDLLESFLLNYGLIEKADDGSISRCRFITCKTLQIGTYDPFFLSTLVKTVSNLIFLIKTDAKQLKMAEILASLSLNGQHFVETIQKKNEQSSN